MVFIDSVTDHSLKALTGSNISLWVPNQQSESLHFTKWNPYTLWSYTCWNCPTGGWQWDEQLNCFMEVLLIGSLERINLPSNFSQYPLKKPAKSGLKNRKCHISFPATLSILPITHTKLYSRKEWPVQWPSSIHMDSKNTLEFYFIHFVLHKNFEPKGSNK